MKTQIAAALIALCTSSALADSTDVITESKDGNMVMESSHPHIQPQLMTLQTAQVLESFGIGFSGDGNIYSTIKNWTKNPLRGSVIMGLGDVAEVGFGEQNILTSTQTNDRVEDGQIKLQLYKDDNGTLPSVSIMYSQNLQNSFNDLAGKNFNMNRQQGELLSSWTWGSSTHNIGIHPGLVVFKDEITNYDGNIQTNRISTQLAYQLGITWQTKDRIVYMLEAGYDHSLKDSTLAGNSGPHYEGTIIGNVGVRFFLRNWLFMDAGIKSKYMTEQNVINPEIHANFTGVIPLKTVFSRSANLQN